jgi:hypothetical protein
LGIAALQFLLSGGCHAGKPQPTYVADGSGDVKNTTSVGDRSELEIATALTRIGKNILRPLSAGLRYDLAVDNGDGTIVRLQCKTGIFKNGAVYFRACNADGRRPNGVAYRGQIEAFAVYCPQTGGTYLVPIAALASISTARLRVDPARNGQSKGVLFARDFQIGGADSEFRLKAGSL